MSPVLHGTYIQTWLVIYLKFKFTWIFYLLVFLFVKYGSLILSTSPTLCCPTAYFPLSFILTKPQPPIFPDSSLSYWLTLACLWDITHDLVHSSKRRNWQRDGAVDVDVPGSQTSNWIRGLHVQKHPWALLPLEMREAISLSGLWEKRESKDEANLDIFPRVCLLSLPLHVPTSSWPFSLATK